ncbi:MAG: ABC transporter permease [Balneolaceae bacterium]
MFKNYLKIAFRNLWKHKIDSAISIGGLAVGLACCILLLFYVRFEWTFDNFHENEEQIYRITDQTQSSDPDTGEIQIRKSVIHPYPLGAALESSFPGIDQLVQISNGQIYLREGEEFVTQRATFATPGFFRMFTFPLLYGDKETALSDPGNIVLTEETALRLFGSRQVVGETVVVRLHQDLYTLTVSGVAETVPANSSIRFEMVLPFENFFRNEHPDQQETMRESWWVGFSETWLTLKEGTSPEHLKAVFPSLLTTHFGEMAERQNMELGLQALNEVYFDQDYSSAITGSTNRLYSMILAGIALVILAIAGMNFMSLSLTRAWRRGHEMGIRKAAGAHARQIRFQLLGEVAVTCGIAFLLGMVIAEIANPLFQQITGRTFRVDVMNDPMLWLWLAGMVLLVTLITGGYPALKMSRRKASLLFSSRQSAARIPRFVNGLICLQFVLAIVFIIVTFTMNRQMRYVLNKDLGFSAEQVIAIEVNIEGEDASRVAGLFSEQARMLPDVAQVSVIGSTYRSFPDHVPFQRGYGIGMGTWQTSTTLPGFENGIITFEIVDEHYLETLGIELLSGRNFSSDRPGDLGNGVLVNQTFAEVMGWEHPVGEVLDDKAEGWTPSLDGKEVIGVVGDFHFKPLFEQMRPIVLQHLQTRDIPPQTILVKTGSVSLSEAVNRLTDLWNRIAPEEAFNYHFLDELVALQYLEEQRWESIMRFSTFMAVALACFGLFGLAALVAQGRTKEIGIRKILGAGVAQIVALLNKDFLKLVFAGFVIAIPIAWYVMNRWLEDFAYRIEIGPGVFLLAGAVAVLIAFATVSWQSVRAAVADPVDSLRTE